MNKDELLRRAFEGMGNAYAPYSNYHVGACVLTKDGNYFIGCNIENASYPVGVCGERVAIFNAYANGYTKEDIEALAIVTDGERIGTPCGMCRQALNELLRKDTPIILSNGKDEMITNIDELLPYSFSDEDLG
ncbi:MAG: cytidine deaminase [Erysipelotrichaceae bacterium]|nr:cytidine deaminase [Erysipelotrichaceae bacterium]